MFIADLIIVRFFLQAVLPLLLLVIVGIFIIEQVGILIDEDEGDE